MRRKKLLEYIQRRYGIVPNSHYYHGDLEETKTYYEYRKDRLASMFDLDDITWQDLSMDDVYKRINNTLSTSGEQVLYYLLRRPAENHEEHSRRKNLIRMVEENATLRQHLQIILARLGKSKYAKLTDAYHPPNHSPLTLLICVGAVILFVLGLSTIPLWNGAKTYVVISAFMNLLLHTIFLKRIIRDIDTVQYSVSMVNACHQVEKLKEASLFIYIPNFLSAGRKTSALRKYGGVTVVANSDVAQIVNSLFLVDIISFELIKNKLAKYHNEIFQIHEGLGQLDAAISIASYRVSAEYTCVPTLHYESERNPFIRAKSLVHPLVQKAVPNDIDTSCSILLTGSNASGKSTYLKSAVLGAILAQTIATAPSEFYEATAFRTYTSMAIRDNVIEGDSYFVAEIKSLKRIMDALEQGTPILCGIDEVLRGTNTIERIAASSEVLSEIASKGALCIAATHDIELCDLLGNIYSLFHFEEEVEGTGVRFDYCVRKGPSVTRNAIKLLGVLGFHDTVVTRAEQKAEQFQTNGQW